MNDTRCLPPTSPVLSSISAIRIDQPRVTVVVTLNQPRWLKTVGLLGRQQRTTLLATSLGMAGVSALLFVGGDVRYAGNIA